MLGRTRIILGWPLAAALAAPCPAAQEVAPAPSRGADPGVERSGFPEGRPSPQQPAYEPPPVPPPSYAPPASLYPPPTAYPPTQPAYPTPYMMVPVAAPPAATAPPAGNFFLPGAAPGYAPAAPGYAVPTAPAYAMPVAPQATLAASSVSVPTSKTKTTVEIRGPGMLSAALAKVGERMVQLGRTRVRTVQETVLETPQVQSTGGAATISTLGLVPAPPQAAPPSYAPPQPPPPPPEVQPPSPSPQGGPTAPRASFAQRLFGRE